MKYLKYEESLHSAFSSVIMDTLDNLGCRVQCMHPDMRPLVPSMRTWGEAVTARFAAVREAPQSPYGLEIQVVDGLREGQVLVSECDSQELSAAWGGLLTNRRAEPQSQRRGDRWRRLETTQKSSSSDFQLSAED